MNLKKQNPETADLIATVLFGNFYYVYCNIMFAISKEESGNYLKFVNIKLNTY